MRNFELYGQIDVEPIKLAIAKCHDRWQDLTFRQSTQGTPHVDTETLYLRMPPVIDKWHIFESPDVVDYPLMEVPAFSNAIRRIEQLTYQQAARVMIVNLKAGGRITPHVDEGEYAHSTDRYHLCITTNESCFMKIGNEVVYANPEELWFFDKQETHSCENHGNEDRIHMIVDCWRE